MAFDEATFRKVLLEKGFCTRIEIGRAGEKSKVNNLDLVDNLLALNYIDSEQVALAYSLMGGSFGVPELFYSEHPEQYAIDTIGAGCFKEEEFQNKKFIPLDVDNVSILMLVNPFDELLIKYLEEKYPVSFKLGVISSDKLEMILSTHYSSLNLLDSTNAFLHGKLSEIEKTDTDIRTSLFNIIRNAIRDRASDIHFVQSDVDATVTVRIDGDIHIVETTSKAVLQRYISKIEEFTIVDDTNKKVPRTGNAKIDFKENGVVNLRVSFIPGKFGLDVNCRIINDKAIKVSNLGFSDEQLSKFTQLLSLTKGLILIVGPTGSGKSTSLYGGLSLIHSKKVMSVEDPVEYIVPGMLQVDISEGNGVTFLKVIKAFMRHDPDVIVIGEIRDLEVANAAIIAANTGHLVISTLHTNSAITAANRLITMGVDRYSICEELSAVMSQRLIKRVCPQCKEAYQLEDGSPWIRRYGLKVGQTLVHGKGCAACKYTGYLGRIAVTEVLRIDKSIRNAIEKQLSTAEIEEIAVESGFVSMLDDAKSKALQGVTTFEQVDKLRFDLE